jgi:hypothetical protein
MRRKMQLTMTLWVTDLPDEVRKENLDGMGGEEEYGSRLEDLHEYMEQEAKAGWSEGDPRGVAGRIESHLSSKHMQEVLFEGSDSFVTIDEVTCMDEKWIGEPEGDRPADRSDG